MTIRVEDLLSGTRFPMLAVDPSQWAGASFVGEVDKRDGVVSSVAFVYQMGLGPESSGYTVSNLDGQVARATGATPEVLGKHLTPFVARFDPAAVIGRVRRKRTDAFPLESFRRTTMVVTLPSGSIGAEVYRHGSLPLQAVHVAYKVGTWVTDVVIGSWNEDPVSKVPFLEPVDVRFARAFDAMGEPEYPPPEWSEPDQL